MDQDARGFIYIGTNGSGLYKFDGIDYTAYGFILNDSTSLSNNVVNCPFVDSKERLWVGTENGLNLYNRDKDNFIRIPNDKFGIEKGENLIIRSLAEGNNGELFIGTYGSGIYKLNLEDLSISKIFSSELNRDETITVLDIEADNYGKIYAATNLGIQEYDAERNIIKPYYYNQDEWFSEPIQSLEIDEDNNIWAGSISNGLFKLSQKDRPSSNQRKVENFNISNRLFFSILSLDDGTILCGTENDGLYHLKKNGELIHKYSSKNRGENSIVSNSIWSLYQDKDRRIWLGYYDKGVGLHDKLYDKFKDLQSVYSNSNPDAQSLSSVTSLTQDSLGNFWVAMDGGGLGFFEKETKSYTNINKGSTSPFSGLTSDYIQTAFIDSKQNLWLGSWEEGLFLLKKGSNRFINYTIENTANALNSNTVLSIDEDSKGTIWIATFHNGLQSFDPETQKFIYHNTPEFEEVGVPTSDCWKVLVDSEDKIWLGTTSGLYLIQRNVDGGFKVESYGEKLAQQYGNPITANHILSIYESSDNLIWFGTKGAGLCKYNPKTDSIYWYNRLNGLNLKNIYSIMESGNNNLWVTGNAGITKINVPTNTFSNYTVNDGLLSNDFIRNAVYKDEEGNIYLGSQKGVDFFNPDSLTANSKENYLYLSDLKLFNKKVLPTQKNSPLKKVITETDTITLTTDQSVFTIEYSGINYTRPEENEYAYYLEGYENSWNYVGNSRNATYTNLDPGSYTFKLKSANNDGKWNEEPLLLHINVLPPWWKTNWALFGYLVFLLFSLILLNKLTQMRVREKQNVKHELERREQEKELNEKKFQFFTNISHEFRTPLSLIMNPLEEIMEDSRTPLPLAIKDKLRTVYKNTSRLHRLVNELLDFRKLELTPINVKARPIKIYSFAHDIASHFKEEAVQRNIKLDLYSDDHNLVIWADEGMIEKIIFNLLSNAFKATPEDGEISLKLFSKLKQAKLDLINKEDPVDVLEISISDTGPGIEKDQIDKIFERFYQVENLNRTYFGGTGIGLEVVQNFVVSHRGKIEVESIIGKGTTFKVILPKGKDYLREDEILSDLKNTLKQNEVFLDSTIEEEAHLENIDILNGDHSHSLLIIDDNIELRNYLKNQLKDSYKIILAKNGIEGLEKTYEYQPDIILTDVIMPEMDGFEFCKRVKSDAKTSHIPVLMLTAKTRIDDRIEGIGLGADAYMAKPFNMKLLKLRLSQLVSSRQLIYNKYFKVISNQPSNGDSSSQDKDFMVKLLNYINENIADPDISVESLAEELNLSRSQLYRKIKSQTNYSAIEFIRNCRLLKAKQMIEGGNTNIKEVSFAVGFSTPSYFSKCFKQYFNVLPTEVVQS